MVAVVARIGPVWWANACRVLYVIDETDPIRRVGFAYGTLPGHAERGEERFCVELADDGGVWSTCWRTPAASLAGPRRLPVVASHAAPIR